ncbi:MAG: sulfatase-like hydrolase/transferase [Hyphomonadaceae bacterium]
MLPLRPTLLAAVFAFAGCTAASPGPEQQQAAAIAAKPNVVIILADDLGYADISTYGIKRINTPNIDRIAKSGVAFTDGYSAAPVCSPSRAGLNTGRHPDRFGFEFNNGPAQRDIELNLGIPKDEIILAKALKGQGYHTGLIGKWHLGSNDDFYPTNRGYDEFVGFLTGATSYINPKAPGVIVSKPDGSEAIPPAKRTPPNRIIEGPDKTFIDNEDRYLTEYLGERAVEYIKRNAASETPYFLFTAFNAPHDPLMTLQKYYDRFPQIQDEGLRVYASMISALDDQVGAIIDAVEASGENNNTIIYFMSDNGCAAYIKGICDCQPLRGGKLSHYEGGTRVPFLMRWPGHVEGGQVYRKVVSTMDVFTTSLTAAGGSLPNDRVFDGVDLIPYVTGKNAGIPHDQLAWRRTPNASIRKGDWKMWKDLSGKFTYLFNLKEDPNEANNLADKEPAKLKELTDAFNQWAKDMKDPAWPSRPFVNYNVCGTPFELPI